MNQQPDASVSGSGAASGAASGPASPPQPFPADLRAFVDAQEWTYAKTMPEWPHEYIVRDRVDERLFVRLVEHIRAHGREGRFYRTAITCYHEAGLVYWTMGAPPGETTIVNRCAEDQTYEYRLEHGALPSVTHLR